MADLGDLFGGPSKSSGNTTGRSSGIADIFGRPQPEARVDTPTAVTVKKTVFNENTKRKGITGWLSRAGAKLGNWIAPHITNEATDTFSETVVNSFDDAVRRSHRAVNLPKNAPASEKASAWTDAVMGIANLALSPMSATLAAAEQSGNPLTRANAWTINKGFKSIDDAARWYTNLVIDRMPETQTRENLRKTEEDLVSFVAQVLVAKGGEKLMRGKRIVDTAKLEAPRTVETPKGPTGPSGATGMVEAPKRIISTAARENPAARIIAPEKVVEPSVVSDLSRTAKNSLENDTTGVKPNSVERAKVEIQKGKTNPIRVRTLEDGTKFIEDGRHRLEAARQLGIKDYPIEDVTSHYTPKLAPESPLLTEARKYKSAEEFHKAFTQEIKHGRYYHITDDPNFKIDLKRGPRDMSSLASGEQAPGSLMTTSDLQYWAENYPNRKYVAVIDKSNLKPSEYTQVDRNMGNEFFIKDASKVRVEKVIPLVQALKEDAAYRATLPQNKSQLTSIWEEANKGKAETPKSRPAEDTKFVSRVYERLKAEHEQLGDSITYDPVKLQEDAAYWADAIVKDKNQVYRVAMGAEPPPSGHTATTANIALAEKALADGNNGLYARLTKNRSLEQTRRGQEISAERGSVTDNSTSRYVKEIISVKLDKLGSQFLSGLTDPFKKKTAKMRAMDKIDSEVKRAEKVVRGKRFDIKEAQAILDKLACK